ncbi:DNA cytosine methyltransferase [Pyruvatibacter mobilis]|uniref:DNA cytosine methyltransferase n=1 Tax=Pyruvatibacter mobilis TaxID=1712261 RepID=UPI003BAA5154
MKIIDLFCGGGGFSLGAHSAGFDVTAAFDSDKTLTSSFEINFPSTKLFLRDVSSLTGAKLVDELGGQIDGIIGGPPCQGFSTIGRRDPNDPRRTLVSDFFRLVQEVQPRFFVFENVSGLASPAMSTVLTVAMKQTFKTYNVLGPVVLDAASFGAATSRKRLFVVGMHRETGVTFNLEDLRRYERPPTSVKSAIFDIYDAENLGTDELGFDRWKICKKGRPSSYARRMRSSDLIFTSHRAVQHKKEIAKRFSQVKPGFTDSIGRHPRLKWDGQCPTLRAGTGPDKGSRQAVRPIHPEANRVITVREAARLQGFPDDHLFHPTIWHSFRMIGNSVSPIIAEAILRAVGDSLGLTDGIATAAA